ncbi:Oidioi.mRNA.OKI2018_I69.XSR.g15189.t1.cds [Oikopleura dioica]|uniref:Oidioi.mRNA.OKI2018_I69.XSR.g15189.t1.cds n=1 Tax=Oikopleura dioica TaxID=34765 RepID=A0ABN7SG16_OIKDI|nr:Oidioi.mRNA.OKI2018_I69.XSR.g15189.t1.cds [Oikopleura dioica]
MSNEIQNQSDAVEQPVAQQEAPKVIPTYEDAFPQLGGGSAPAPGGAWINRANVKPIKSSITSVRFDIPLEERRFRPGLNEGFGKGTSADQGRAEVLKIMKATKTEIEYSQQRDGSITVLISGKPQPVKDAKKMVLANMTQQGSIDVLIPKEHHRFILGKGAETLKKLEAETGTKITVPKADEAEGAPVRITGAKDAMKAAKAKIERISAEQMARYRATFECPIEYQPFIRGGNDSNLNSLKTRHGILAIDVPPPSAGKTEIVVRGPQKGAVAAVAELKAMVQLKSSRCTTLTIKVEKKQHRFVIGQRGKSIQDILEEHGVIVEVPPQDSSSEEIVLRGEPQALGNAITAVYGLASSKQDAFVDAPEWMHRLLIGNKGAAIKEITDNFGFEKVQVDFKNEDGKCGIALEGSPSELEAVKNELLRRIKEIKSTTSHEEIVVNPKFHPHLIGKGGSNISKLKEEHKVIIKIPQDSDKNTNIWIEGPPAGVKAAKAALTQLANKIADEAADKIILKRRFHRQIIGQGGENIKKLRDQFPNVNISIPDENSKSDEIAIRGPSKELAKAKEVLSKMARDIEERGFRLEVPILKRFHRNIIGKNGSNITRIREATNCQIELPKEDTDSEIITIIGRKADCEKAQREIRKIEKELGEIEEITVKIETKLHQALIGAGGKGVKNFKVTIRGKPEAVKAAKKALEEEAGQVRLQSFTAKVNADPSLHRFLIGKNGSNIKDIRDTTGCRIAVPGANEEKQDQITILGTKEGVAKAKEILEKRIKELESIEEHTVDVPEKYHKNFTARRAELINKISEDCGGVQISFPRKREESEEVDTVVSVKGPGNCVKAAIAQITEAVEDFEAQVTIQFDVDKAFHRTIIGQGGKQVQEIQSDFNVNIKFPGRDEPDDCNTITVSGREEKVEAAKAAIIALIPVTFEYELAADYHRDLIGQGGSGLKAIQSEFPSIRITVPKRADGEELKDSITLVGKQEVIDSVVELLNEKKKGWEADAEDRALRSYSETIDVHQMFHPKIIGQKGAVINKLQAEINARITMPSDKNKDLAADEIRITGYEAEVAKMKDAIMDIVKGLESHVQQDVLISQSCHKRIIGARGSGVRKIMGDFDVEIKFGRSQAQPDKVTVIGAADKVEECIDHLLNLEEEILQEIAERSEESRLRPQRVDPFEVKSSKKKGGNAGFKVANAPWDSGSSSDFPTLGNNAGAAPNVNWRPKH